MLDKQKSSSPYSTLRLIISDREIVYDINLSTRETIMTVTALSKGEEGVGYG